MTTIAEKIELSHALKSLTGCTDPIELREALDEWGEGYPDDVNIDIDGEEWRFIHSDHVDEAMQDELASDTYILGCFFPSFLAGVTGWPEALIEAAQKGEAHDALGEAILSSGLLEKLQKEAASADGYGHHFASYDGEEHELAVGNDRWLAFRVG